MPVIDASVYVALINANEREHGSSWAWFERVQAAGEAIIAPVIMLAEVASAISRGIGDPELALQVVNQLRNSGVVELASVTLSVAEQAAGIAAEYKIRGCDAIYVAMALQLDETLVTLDRQQLERWGAIVVVGRP